MAATNILVLTAIALIVLPTIAMATDYIVGGDNKWANNNFDYKGWAKNQEFFVGDNLVFEYTVGTHNVFKVNQTSFQNCTVPPANMAFTSGHDVITLTKPGQKWYICGFPGHCTNGQKLSIMVNEAAPSPAPTPATSAAHGIATAASQLVMVAVAAAAAILF